MKLQRRNACIPAVLFALLSCFAGDAAAQEQRGVAAVWDVRLLLRSLVVQAERYKAAVDTADTAQWVTKGAAESYGQHKDNLQKQVGYLHQMSTQLFQSPEKLSLALDVLFRLQALDNATMSLAEGAQKYDAVKLYDEFQRLLEQNLDLRTKLREYVMDLSVARESEFAIAEQEAHRCQASLNRNPLAPEPKTNPAAKK